MWNNFFFIGLPYITVTLFFWRHNLSRLKRNDGRVQKQVGFEFSRGLFMDNPFHWIFRPRFHRTRILVPALGHTHSSVRSSYRIYRRRVQSCFLGWFFQMGGPRRWNSFSLRSCMGFFTQNNNSAGQGHEHAR